MEVLGSEHELNANIDRVINEGFLEASKIRKVQELAERLKDEKYVRNAEVIEVDAGKGKAIVKIDMDEQAFREICEGIMGQEIGSKKDWLLFVKEAPKRKSHMTCTRKQSIQLENKAMVLHFRQLRISILPHRN